MPNYIEPTDMPANRFVISTSRYSNSTPIYYHINDQRKIAFTTYKKIDGANEVQDSDIYAVVTAGTEYRPDLVSYKAYGVPDFWWRILEANNIKDVFDFKAGLNIRLPQNIF